MTSIIERVVRGIGSLTSPAGKGAPLTVLLYHRVLERPDELNPGEPSAAQFDQQMSVLARMFNVLSLGKALARLSDGTLPARALSVTFDDGYRDNLQFAYPIFRRRNLPFAIYVPTDFPDGAGDLWWLALEKVVDSVTELRTAIDGEVRIYGCATAAEKDRTFREVYWWLRSIDETEARRYVRELSAKTGVDIAGMCRELVMTWDEIRRLAADPLVTIGAHTRRHYALAKLTALEAEAEMSDSIDRLQGELGRRPEHFSYPYGCPHSAGAREFAMAARLGMKTAVTTRKGMLFAEHGDQSTALPRLATAAASAAR